MAGIKHNQDVDSDHTVSEAYWEADHVVTGDVPFGGHQITNPGDVDGVDVGSHQHTGVGSQGPKIDHGDLDGKGDDDHAQYYNNVRHTKVLHDALGIPGWHGSTNTIKVAAHEFVPTWSYDSAYFAASLVRNVANKTNQLNATVYIPSGYKAVSYVIYADGNYSVSSWECDIDDDTSTPKGGGNANSTINMTDVASSSTNYLVLTISLTYLQEVWGAKVNIQLI